MKTPDLIKALEQIARERDLMHAEIRLLGEHHG